MIVCLACSRRRYSPQPGVGMTDSELWVCLRAPNGSHAKLCGHGPRAEAEAARRLPRMTFVEPSRDLQPP